MENTLVHFVLKTHQIQSPSGLRTESIVSSAVLSLRPGEGDVETATMPCRDRTADDAIPSVRNPY